MTLLALVKIDATAQADESETNTITSLIRTEADFGQTPKVGRNCKQMRKLQSAKIGQS